MFSKNRLAAILCLFLGGSVYAQIEDPFVRYPSISPDGKTLAFSYQGDIWTVPSTGGRAYRLTLNEAYESRPKWHPDGKHLAFNSDRFGNQDIFTIDVAGSAPTRLTYHSNSDTLSGWTTDGGLLFTTVRDLPFGWESEIFTVSQEGGTPKRLTNALGEMPSMSPNGNLIAFVRGAAQEFRKRYRGPANLEVWIWNRKTGQYHQISNFAGNDFLPVWNGDQQLRYISDSNGTHNIYQIAINTDGSPNGAPQSLTNFKEDGARYFDVAADGTMVVEKDTHIYLISPGANAQKVSIIVPEDGRFLDETAESFTSGATEVAISPEEKQVAIVVRGELFLIKNDPKKKRTVRLTKHPFRDRDIQWHGEQAIIFASDRMGGQYDLFAVTSGDEDQPDLYKALSFKVTRLTQSSEDDRNPVISPDGKRVAYNRGRGQLVVAEIGEDHTLSNEIILHDGWQVPSGITWSPDSFWLAYSQENLEFNAEIYIHAADGSKGPVNVSYHPRVDRAPFWSEDGSKLGFISSRNNGDEDLWFVWLKRSDWEKTRQDWDEDEDETPKKKPKQKDEDKEEDEDSEEDGPKVEPITIDFENIHQRLQQVTSLPGNETDLAISKDGETFYFIANADTLQSFDADQDVFQIKWDGSDLKELTKGGKSGGSLIMGDRYQYLYFIQRQGRLNRIDLKKSKKEGLGYSAKMEINHPGERRQVFNEAWRALDQYFYDPKFHGVNWKNLGDKYGKWALKASTNQDFQDVFNMMLGELNASHLGLYNSDRYQTAEDRTGLLGADVEAEKDGFRVTGILPYSPADRETSRLSVGDVITAIDGQDASGGTNFFKYFKDTVNEKVRLTVRNAKGETRAVVIRPAGSLRNDYYNEFVESRKRLVDQFSNGRLGYVHIRGMNWSSFEAFERALSAEGDGKDGLVIDVRYNGGGWTTDYLLTVLSVRQHAYTIPRGASDNLQRDHEKFSEYYPYGERLPMSGWTRPSVTLCNQFSYSNAEIFSHAFKTLGIGPLVGMPTFGAVISTGGTGLLDGSFVRLPYRGWYVKKTNENMENGPAVPNHVVPDPPGALLEGQDPQLKKAVEVLIQQIDAN